MGSVPIQRTWAIGEIVTAAEMNSNVRDAINFCLAPPRVVLTRSTVATINSNASPFNLPFDTETIDTDTMHSGSNGFVQANTSGLFDIFLQIHYNFITGMGQTQYFMCGFQVNAGTWNTGSYITQDVRCGSLNSGFGTSVFVGQDVPLSAGDQVFFFTAQTSGSAVTINSGAFGAQATVQWVADS